MRKPATTDHPILPLLSERWSPRAFASTPVPDELLSRLFEAARWSPSCFNEQPWSFVVGSSLRPDDHARVLSLLSAGNVAWARRAPVLVIGVTRTRFAHNDKPNAWAWYDLGQSMAHLSVQASSEGLYVHQMAGFDRERAAEVLGLPEGWEAAVAMAVGYEGDVSLLSEAQAEKEVAPRVRKPQSAFVFQGKIEG